LTFTFTLPLTSASLSFSVQFIIFVLLHSLHRIMYGGLFGDLPSAKGEGNDDNDTKRTDDSIPQSVQITDSVEQLPTQRNKNKEASVLLGMGSKGAVMSFMPVALRQRKRPPPSKLASASVKQPLPILVKLDPVKPTEPEVDYVHREKSAIEKEDTFISSSTQSSVPSLEGESEERRQLHANVLDPYDPHFPNDLQAYWSRKAAEKHRLYLEKEARDTLERQQRLRDELDQERREIEKKGNIQEIIQHRVQTSMGRGRGRGVSNLPAWMVNQHKEEARLGSAPFDDILNRTVILSNLTAPGRIDDDLCDEVKEECEGKCGTVESVSVKDSNPPTQPAVEVTVLFRREGDAEKAALLFHGRLFGQRRVTATRLGR
jgi:hypothetical protein